MSTPSCQISTPNRIVVFEYDVLKVFVCKSDTFFWVHPVHFSLAHGSGGKQIHEKCISYSLLMVQVKTKNTSLQLSLVKRKRCQE